MKPDEGDRNRTETKCLAASNSISYDGLVGRPTLFTSLAQVTPTLAFPPDNHFTFDRNFWLLMFRRFLFAFMIVVWLSAVACGMALVWSYNHRPGEAAVAPAHWPADSHVTLADGYTLVMLAHPKCPCTRATVEELSKLMTHTEGRLKAFVLFVKPLGVPKDWDRTDLWQSASAIPGVTVLNDEDGTEAKRFDAHVSGQVMVYDREGRLVFQGGITESRGQMGDNAGRSAIEAQVNKGISQLDRTLVFGCPLFDADECRMPDHGSHNR